MTLFPHRTLSRQTRRQEAGFTLIELMVAMTLGMVIVSAVGYLFISNRQTYRVQDAMARLQESARYTYEVLSNDIRMAGFTGCSSGTTENIVDAHSNSSSNPDNDWYKNLFGSSQIGSPAISVASQPLFGYEDTAPADVCSTPSTAPCHITGDGITVLRADNSKEYIVQSHASPNFTLTATPASGSELHQGEIVIVSNCTDATALFQVTDVSGATVEHAATGTPGNYTNTFAGTFGSGSRIYRLSAVTYYIGQNPAGEPALYRRRLSYSGTNPSTVAEELVEGVEDMQMAYGVDTDTTADGQVNGYQSVADIQAGTGSPAVPGANAAERWRRVLSVRVSLLLRTSEDGITTQSQTYAWDANHDGTVESVTAGDRRLRRAVSFVITLRNRL